MLSVCPNSPIHPENVGHKPPVPPKPTWLAKQRRQSVGSQKSATLPAGNLVRRRAHFFTALMQDKEANSIIVDQVCDEKDVKNNLESLERPLNRGGDESDSPVATTTVAASPTCSQSPPTGSTSCKSCQQQEQKSQQKDSPKKSCCDDVVAVVSQSVNSTPTKHFDFRNDLNHLFTQRMQNIFGSIGKGSLARKRRPKRPAIRKADIIVTHVVVVPADQKLSIQRSKSLPDNKTGTMLYEEAEQQQDNNRISTVSYDSGVSDSCSGTSTESGSSLLGLEMEGMTPSQRKANEAFKVARELMTSERAFVNVLHLLNITFREFVASKNDAGQLLPQAEFEKVFSNMKELLILNGDLLKDFETRIENWEQLGCRIADIIVRKGHFLKMYASYVKDFPIISTHYEDCLEKYPKFKKCVEEFEAMEICKHLRVPFYMLKPVQRLPQYKLLFENYIKCLSEDNPDYQDAVKALDIVSQAATHANERMKQSENFKRVLKLQSRLGESDIIRPDRELLREGIIHKMSRNTIEARYLILLSDCLIYAKKTGDFDGLREKYRIPLTTMTVSLPRNAVEYPKDFILKSPVRSCTFRASSSGERDIWVDALHDAISTYKKRRATFATAANLFHDDGISGHALGHSAPVWVPDERVTMCQKCHVDFSILLRRHHCRACGQVVCGNCSEDRAPLKYKNYKSDRVCKQCYDVLWKELECNPGVRSRFKRKEQSAQDSKANRKIPGRRLVTATDAEAQMNGNLYHKASKTAAWKRRWFVLKDRVLYTFRGAEDGAADQTCPVLGYELEAGYMERPEDADELPDGGRAFRLTHAGRPPLLLYAENENTAEKWIAAFAEAIRL